MFDLSTLQIKRSQTGQHHFEMLCYDDIVRSFALPHLYPIASYIGKFQVPTSKYMKALVKFRYFYMDEIREQRNGREVLITPQKVYMELFNRGTPFNHPPMNMIADQQVLKVLKDYGL